MKNIISILKKSIIFTTVFGILSMYSSLDFVTASFDISEKICCSDSKEAKFKIMCADYNNCLVNVSNSILKCYGVKNEHDTLKELDVYLAKGYKNVVLLLYDGFGSNLIKRHLGENSFLYKNKIKDITSVFPATTTAATTSLITGKTPMEHCWLGWDIYIKSIDKTITMYKNVLKGTKTKAANRNVANEEFPYVTIFDKINESNNAKAYCVSPYEGVIYDSDEPDQMYDKIIDLCKDSDKKFIYAYCREPDHSMHDYGTDDDKIIEIMKTLDKKTNQLCDNLEDTLIIITADHGHMTAGEHIVLDDYPILKNMLIRETSLEPRTTNFFVKIEMLKLFKQEFNKLFGKYFTLLSKQEVIDKKLFGDGIPHEKFESCLGDYLAIAISDKSIDDKYDPNPLKGLHAGSTEDEILIPLIVVERRM